MTDLTFLPRVTPRNRMDALLSFGIALLQLFALFVFPALVCFWLTHSGLAALAIVFVFLIVFRLFVVDSVTVTPGGLRFARRLGNPTFLAWSAIVSVEEAPRAELIVRGWLWPLFPAREMTPSFTSHGHYRVVYAGGCVYFPPDEPLAFEAAIQRYLPSAVSQGHRPRLETMPDSSPDA